jgi:6-phosphogluconolactonase
MKIRALAFQALSRLSKGQGFDNRVGHAALSRNRRSDAALQAGVRFRGWRAAVLSVATLAGALTYLPAAQAASYVYVSNEDSHDVSVFAFDEQTGALSPLQTVSTGGIAMPMVLSANQLRLYVGVRTAPYRVLDFSVDPRTGQLTQLGEAPLANSMAYLSLDRSGKFLFSASYGGNMFSVNPIGPDGRPGNPQQTIPTGPMSHSIMASPDNRFVYGAVLGADQWLKFSFDPASGALTQASTPALTLPSKSGPRFFRFAPDGKHVYLIDELDARIHVLSYDAQHGTVKLEQTVSALPPDFGAQVPWGSDVHVTPNGRFLYASERRSSTITGFRIAPGSGKLTRIDSWPSETQTRGFNIDPTGHFLIAAGEKSGHVTVYKIDPHGRLQPIGRQAAGAGPNWIEFAQFNGSTD